MCTAVVRYAPGDEWPILLAFVRDELRSRTADAPAAWWPEHAHVVGGRDRAAGGTWLAVDAPARSASFVTNRYEPGLPPPMQAGRRTRGTVALELLDGGRIDGHEAMAPFHAVRVRAADGGRWWHWDAATLSEEPIAAGVTVIASRGTMLPGEADRRALLTERFAQLPTPSLTGASPDAWGPWITELDGRRTAADDMGALVVHSVTGHPGFGTVGASLVALAADGRVRYDVNHTTDLDPAAWSRVELPAEAAS